jgi:hypothetical protein
MAPTKTLTAAIVALTTAAATLGLAIAPAITAASQPTPKPTSSTLVIKSVTTGLDDNDNADGLADWTVTVAGRGPTAPPSAPATFVLMSQAAILATFTATSAHPYECTFTTTVTGDGVTYQAANPTACSGGTAGYVSLDDDQVQSPRTHVYARYPGAPGWRSSCSGSLNPENIRTNGRPVRSHGGSSPCKS